MDKQFGKECARFEITTDEKKIEILKCLVWLYTFETYNRNRMGGMENKF